MSSCFHLENVNNKLVLLLPPGPGHYPSSSGTAVPPNCSLLSRHGLSLQFTASPQQLEEGFRNIHRIMSHPSLDHPVTFYPTLTTIHHVTEALHDLPALSPTPSPTTVPTAPFSQTHRPPCSSSSAPSTLLSLHLCCSLSLNCPSPQMSL